MEKSKQVGSTSSSSFTVDLFGPKEDSSKSSTSSTTGLFGSIFGPPTIVRGRDTSQFNSGSAYENSKHGSKDDKIQKSNGSQVMMKEKNSIEPCYYNSSIYYGGQQVYSPTNHHHNNISNPHHVIKKKDAKDDPNENNSNSASRGNWWEGSLYY